jgi:hypothetical protein
VLDHHGDGAPEAIEQHVEVDASGEGRAEPALALQNGVGSGEAV